MLTLFAEGKSIELRVLAQLICQMSDFLFSVFGLLGGERHHAEIGLHTDLRPHRRHSPAHLLAVDVNGRSAVEAHLESVRIACFSQQLLRSSRVELHQRRVERGTVSRDLRCQDGCPSASASPRKIRDAISSIFNAWYRTSSRAHHLSGFFVRDVTVVQLGAILIEIEEVDLCAVTSDRLHGVRSLQPSHILQRRRRGQVNFAGQQRRHAGRIEAIGRKTTLVRLCSALCHQVRVGLEDGFAVRPAADQDERAGSVGVVVREALSRPWPD